MTPREFFNNLLDALDLQLSDPAIADGKGADAGLLICSRGKNEVSNVRVIGAVNIRGRRRIRPGGMRMVDAEVLETAGAHAAEDCEEVLGGDLKGHGTGQRVSRRKSRCNHPADSRQQATAFLK